MRGRLIWQHGKRTTKTRGREGPPFGLGKGTGVQLLKQRSRPRSRRSFIPFRILFVLRYFSRVVAKEQIRVPFATLVRCVVAKAPMQSSASTLSSCTILWRDMLCDSATMRETRLRRIFTISSGDHAYHPNDHRQHRVIAVHTPLLLQKRRQD